MMTQEADIRGGQTRLDGDLAGLARRLSRATAQVRARGSGGGSGVIWRSGGLIITNAHVVRGAHAWVELADGREFQAALVKRDPRRDLAALAIGAADLPAAVIGDSESLRVGEWVLAVGNPLGLVGAVTAGIIQGLGPCPPGLFGPRYPMSRLSWIQADVHLAPGNSGGPLADAQGRVIGINSMVAYGLAWAIPSHEVERFLSGEQPPHYIGVGLRPVRISGPDGRRFGLLVLEIEPGSPAEQAGLRIGDVLIGAGERAIHAPDDLLARISDTPPGSALAIELVRGGRPMTSHVIVQTQTVGMEGM